MFNVSMSAFQTWQKCEQQYDYSYRRGLRPLERDPAPERGVVLHEYLETYYRQLSDGVDAMSAHAAGLERIATHGPEFELAAKVMLVGNRPGDVEIYTNMLAQCEYLADRYFTMRGRDDAERYTPLMIEKRVSIQLVAGIQSTGIIDLVLRDNVTGRVSLAEHKTTAAVPSPSVRLRDFQTVLYAEKLKQTMGLAIDSVLWNYLRTKPPEQPAMLKNGKLSRAATMDTTWPMYLAEVHRHGLDPNDFTDVRERLEPRELAVYFPRYEHVIVADSTLLLEDYAVESTRMRRAVWEWDNNRSRPIRTVTRGCDWCSFYRLCEAEIMGGDTDDLIKRHYSTRNERKRT